MNKPEKKKIDKFTKLAAMAMWKWYGLQNMAKQLEKDQRTKIFAYKIAAIATNGSEVYIMYVIPETEKLIKKFQNETENKLLTPPMAQFFKEHCEIGILEMPKDKEPGNESS